MKYSLLDCKLKHGDKYDYSLVEYHDAKTKIKIICPEHGIFEQRLDHHLNGSGCPKCVGHNKSTIELIQKYKSIHGDKYDYSLVNYRNAKTKIKIICPEHGIFELYSKQHIRGVNCSKCVRERISHSQRKTSEQFIFDSKKTHGEKYDYSLVNYINANQPVKIICRQHGIFEQIPRYHVSGSGCPLCKESKGEKQIRLYLESKKIKFTPQYRFNDCKNIRQLPFDFYLDDYNCCIEYQGEQHYLNKKMFGGDNRLTYIENNDMIKKDYCFINNIKFLIISYKEFKQIKRILDDYLSDLN